MLEQIHTLQDLKNKTRISWRNTRYNYKYGIKNRRTPSFEPRHCRANNSFAQHKQHARRQNNMGCRSPNLRTQNINRQKRPNAHTKAERPE